MRYWAGCLGAHTSVSFLKAWEGWDLGWQERGDLSGRTHSPAAPMLGSCMPNYLSCSFEHCHLPGWLGFTAFELGWLCPWDTLLPPGALPECGPLSVPQLHPDPAEQGGQCAAAPYCSRCHHPLPPRGPLCYYHVLGGPQHEGRGQGPRGGTLDQGGQGKLRLSQGLPLCTAGTCHFASSALRCTVCGHRSCPIPGLLGSTRWPDLTHLSQNYMLTSRLGP